MTSTSSIQSQIDELGEQVAFLVEETLERKRLRESISDLSGDLAPIARQGTASITRVMAAFDERGYGEFAKSGLGVVDRVVTSFTEEDVEALGDNIVLILETVKDMTQPEVMRMLRSTLHNVQDQVTDNAVPPSLLALFRQMREPEVRRGLDRLIAVLRSMGQTTENEPDGKEARL